MFEAIDKHKYTQKDVARYLGMPFTSVNDKKGVVIGQLLVSEAIAYLERRVEYYAGAR